MHEMSYPRCTTIGRVSIALVAASLLATLHLGGCTPHPLRPVSEDELRTGVISPVERELASMPAREITLQPPTPVLQDFFPADRLEQLERESGPNLYDGSMPYAGTNLLDDEFESVPVSLQEAIQLAVRNNLNAQIGSLQPAINEADIIAAESRFDAVVFGSVDWNKTDEQNIRPVVGGIPVNTGLSVRDDRAMQAGLRKNLTTGGRMELSTSMNRFGDASPGQALSPDPGYNSSIDLSINQPLLRGAGSEANLSGIRIAQNAHRSQIETYRQELLELVQGVEAAYWSLLVTRHVVQIRLRLFEEGRSTRDKIKNRAEFDASPAEVSDAVSRVESRRVALLRAQTDALIASDRLKRLINAPGLNVASEVMIMPTDSMIDATITFNYYDAVMAALQHRPEVRRTLLSIDDASIRQMLADNLRLPRLDIRATMSATGLDGKSGEALDTAIERQFVNYAVGLVFEFPLGNREAQAAYHQARLVRAQSVINWQRTIQDITLQVKEALRDVKLNYELLEGTRTARLAAKENLRTIEVEEQYQQATTPEFLNLKLSRQESLANAEIAEIAALSDYQVALATLYSAMGVGLERNQVDFVLPDDETDLP